MALRLLPTLRWYEGDCSVRPTDLSCTAPHRSPVNAAGFNTLLLAPERYMEKVPLKPSSSDLALLSLPPDIQKQARAVARIDPYWTAAIAVRRRHGRRRCKVPLTCRRPRVPFVQITLAPTAQNLSGLEQNVTLQRLLMTYTLRTSFVNNFNYTFSGAVCVGSAGCVAASSFIRAACRCSAEFTCLGSKSSPAFNKNFLGPHCLEARNPQATKPTRRRASRGVRLRVPRITPAQLRSFAVDAYPQEG